MDSHYILTAHVIAPPLLGDGGRLLLTPQEWLSYDKQHFDSQQCREQGSQHFTIHVIPAITSLLPPDFDAGGVMALSCIFLFSSKQVSDVIASKLPAVLSIILKAGSFQVCCGQLSSLRIQTGHFRF